MKIWYHRDLTHFLHQYHPGEPYVLESSVLENACNVQFLKDQAQEKPREKTYHSSQFGMLMKWTFVILELMFARGCGFANSVTVLVAKASSGITRFDIRRCHALFGENSFSIVMPIQLKFFIPGLFK
ncbi:hypothetical protein Zmor_002110 [Zophobas morio]|uniref:Uncharacterized protein n=1 Tax=Zophobas morio TaxID=2755281 RepID=A0AA38J476_9CUCU|nr:hypothetical protein Zmor_002110 [Zophobas morio]